MKHSDKNKQNRSKRSNDKSGDFSKASRPKQKQRFKKPKLESVAPTNPNPRLNKYLANAGIASRRASDTLIAAGNVTINDKVVVEMGYRVQPDDVVKFKGKVVEKNVRKVYILMNKPKNTITTTHDPEGRKTVMTILKNAQIGPNVSIGDNCIIENTTVKNSLIQSNTTIKNANLEDAMIGNHVTFDGNFKSISIGDYSVLE